MTQRGALGNAADAGVATAEAGKSVVAPRDSPEGTVGPRDAGAAEILQTSLDVSVVSDSFHGQKVALVRSAGTGCLAAVLSSALFVLWKRQPPSCGWGWHAAAGGGGAAFGWWYSRWKQRVQEQGLARLRKVAGSGTAFMALDSLAPPLPPDAFTEAGERAADELLKQNRSRRGSR